MIWQDLLLEFEKVALRKLAEYRGLQKGGQLCESLEKLKKTIEKRLSSHDRNERNTEYTLKQMLHFFNARLHKPQRLVSLALDEEERRCLRSWQRFDHKLHIACFSSIEELKEFVLNPEFFRLNIRNLVIYMSDQIPMWLKIKPGKQVYAEFEQRKGTYVRNLGSLSGGGTQKAEALLRMDDEDEREGLNDGMTQKRGEASKDQDKFRITVEREQRCYGWCDERAEPIFAPGTTSFHTYHTSPTTNGGEGGEGAP